MFLNFDQRRPFSAGGRRHGMPASAEFACDPRHIDFRPPAPPDNFNLFIQRNSGDDSIEALQLRQSLNRFSQITSIAVIRAGRHENFSAL